MNRKIILIDVLIIALLSILNSCSKDDVGAGESSGTISISSSISSGTAEGDTDNTAEDEDDLLANASFDYTVQISLSGSSASINNPVEGNGVNVEVEDGSVIIESSIAKVAYEISGNLNDGYLKIYSEKKYKLILNDCSITNSTGPAINIQSGKTAFVVLEGSNSLADGVSYSDVPEDEDAKAAFFSEGQLVFSGNGSLSVTSNYKHGIASDDYIRIIEGNITVNKAVKDAIHANDYIVVDGGTINLSASSDGMDCEEGFIVINDGSFTMNVYDDGIVASYDIDEAEEPNDEIDPYVTINGGTFQITCSRGEGIESKSVLSINGGSFEINSKDDGLNAIEELFINGGELYVYSSSNDAIDSNGDMTITGGTVIAIGSRSPEAGFDADRNTFKISGGTVLGLGGSTTSPSSSASTQNSLILGGFNSNTILHIHSESGNEALTFLIPTSASTIVYSSKKLSSNENYIIYSGGSVSDGNSFHGLYSSGSYSGGVSTGSSFVVDSRVTQLGGSTGH
jgi:hypothetical protein